MKLLRLAVEKQRWDLVAHTLILATARMLSKGERPNVNKNQPKNRCPKGQTKP